MQLLGYFQRLHHIAQKFLGLIFESKSLKNTKNNKVVPLVQKNILKIGGPLKSMGRGFSHLKTVFRPKFLTPSSIYRQKFFIRFTLKDPPYFGHFGSPISKNCDFRADFGLNEKF